MPSQISDEKIARINRSHELRLSVGEGAAFSGVNRSTFVFWRKKKGLKTPIKQNGEPQWSRKDIIGHLKRVRVIEGIAGLRTKEMRKNHTGLYGATLKPFHFDNGYSEAFESAFGFPFSSGGMDLAERIQELQESEKEINPIALSKERRVFRKLVRQPYFEQIHQFATKLPELRKRTEREIYEVLARMVLRYLSKPDSYVTTESKHVVPAHYREEFATLLYYATALGLVVPTPVNGTAVYKSSDSAIQTAREMLLTLDWWTALDETQSTEGAALRDIENVLERLPEQDKLFVRPYLMRTLCNPQTYDPVEITYKPRNPDFRRAAILSDTVEKFTDNGHLPPELYATLQLLSPEDSRTAAAFGEYLLRRVPREHGLEILRRMSAQSNPEAAYQAARETARKYITSAA